MLVMKWGQQNTLLSGLEDGVDVITAMLRRPKHPRRLQARIITFVEMFLAKHSIFRSDT